METLHLPTIFDVLLSLTYVFFIVSLFVSGIWEFISTILQDKRATLLRNTLRHLLSDPNFADLVYSHPLIRSQVVRRKPQFLEWAFSWLLNREVDPATREVVLRPSYIDPNVFARAVLGLIQQHTIVPPLPLAPLLTNNLSQVNQWVNALPTSSLKLAPVALQELQAILMALLQDADNGSKVLTSVEKWYNAHMDRVTGYFKQYSQQGIRWVALTVVILFNIDAIHLTSQFYRDPALRDLTVAQATDVVKTIGDSISVTLKRRTVAEQAIRRQFATDSTSRTSAHPDTIKQLKQRRDAALVDVSRNAKTRQDSLAQQRTVLAAEALGVQQLPVGWSTFVTDFKDPVHGGAWYIVKMLVGWLLMVAAISFGAPFWFDLLVKLVNIRNVGKKPETEKLEKT